VMSENTGGYLVLVAHAVRNATNERSCYDKQLLKNENEKAGVFYLIKKKRLKFLASLQENSDNSIR
jgi:hypothetical protein